ncbi:MAG TPA: AAA family ATPase [Actinomycetota bacterium]|nr:AAA family ATPase [Actinomycetota bacterium]
MTCPSCGRENPDDSRFCSACGAPLEAGPALGVRKTVTVVFCDLVGSTALGERTDPEVLRELMGRYHAELRAILERHGGTVEKFVGDAAMAVFGIPQVHEDDALRAVRASIQMRDAVAGLGLEVRIGVNTGEVVAGAGETLVTGDAVNVAARLEQAADSGEILIGAATERLVRDRVLSDATRSLTLKGKGEPVPAFRVRALMDDVPAFTRPIAAPFVGRAEELERLEAALATAVAERTPQLATIVGPPGIGKSRLARELIGRARARVLVGRCLSYGEGITYWPLQEIVAQIGDVGAVLADSPDRELATERIAAAIGDVDTPSTPEEIAWGVRRLFEAVAADEPLVVVFDDIHWAEPTFLDLIEYVAAFAQGVPLLVLCTARADLFDLRPTWAAPQANGTVLTLEPLSEADSEELVSDLGEVPAEAVDRIVETAEGNPLFVEQLVAMRAEGGGGDLEVPPTLQALLAARIDRLAGPERAVIERGSVEGRLFHRGAVAALLPRSEQGDLGALLLALVRKELIRPDRAVLPGDDGFRFGHALIRDAAYEAIPKRERAALHERFADWLVSRLADDASDEIVGYHLEQAYRYGVELGVGDAILGERAAGRLATAASAARARQDTAAAANLLGRAVEIVPVGPVRPALLAVLGEALSDAGELTRGRAVLDESVSLARELGDEHTEWLGRIWLADVVAQQEPEGGPDLMLSVGEAAIASREGAADHEVLAWAWYLVATAHNLRGQMGEYARGLERALPHARQAGDLTLEVGLVRSKAPYFIWGPGPVDEGLRYAEEVMEGPLRHLPGMPEFMLHLLAHMRGRLGEFEGAFEAMSGYRDRLRELGRGTEYAMTAGCVWDVCLWAGDWRRGEAVLRESFEFHERTGNKVLLATVAIQLGEAVFRQGRLEEADRLCRISEEIGTTGDQDTEGACMMLRAKVLSARGDSVNAQAMARRAIDVAAGTDLLELGAGAWLTLAEIQRAAGDPAAEAAAHEALTRYERKGNLVGAMRAQDLLEEMTGSPPAS